MLIEISWFVVSVVSVSGWLDTLIVKVAVMVSSKASCAVTVIVLSPRCSAVVGVPVNDTVVSSAGCVSHPGAGPVTVTVYSRILLLGLLKAIS